MPASHVLPASHAMHYGTMKGKLCPPAGHMPRNAAWAAFYSS